MKKLALYAWGFLTAAVICAAALVAALAIRFFFWEYCTVFASMGGTLAAAFFFNAREKLMTAKTIADSAVIPIQPAVICGQTEKEKEEEELRENFGIYVSSFGILLGTKIIEFNQNGIWLQNVEIGQNYISFGYGARGEELQNIRLLYSKPDKDALAGIVENFRKDTGVVPTVAG